jgi:hypothetical protein
VPDGVGRGGDGDRVGEGCVSHVPGQSNSPEVSTRCTPRSPLSRSPLFRRWERDTDWDLRVGQHPSPQSVLPWPLRRPALRLRSSTARAIGVFSVGNTNLGLAKSGGQE